MLHTKRVGFSALIAALVAAPVFSGPLQDHGNGAHSAQETTTGPVERRVIGRGNWLYESLQRVFPGAAVADLLSVQVVYPVDLDWSGGAALDVNRQLNAWLAREGSSHAVAKDGILDVPNPPETSPPIGTRHSIGVSCATIKTSTSSSFSADITYTFEYRYTRDTNNDNKPDADPQWVVVDVEITPLFAEGLPHLC